MVLLHPEKVGIYAEPQGDRLKLNSTPKIILEALDAIGFRFYYTYANGAQPFDVNNGFDNRGTLTDPGYTPRHITQYGAIWDPTPLYQNATQMNLAKSLGKPIVTYDEPWNPGNGDDYWPEQPISVADALDGWPALMALGNELWSPSVSNVLYTYSNDWLLEFMAGVASRGYRVDAICVHFYAPNYTSNTVNDLHDYLNAMHAMFPSYPLVLSEWSIADFGRGTGATLAESADFAEAGCLLMDGLDYVKAHMWYPATEGTGFFWYNTWVINADGTPTVVGQRFASLLGGTAVTAPSILHPEKIGIGAWSGGDPNHPTPDQVTLNGINTVGFKFYQTWHPLPLVGNQGAINFIPAWWNNGDGDGELTPANLAAMQADGDLIIGSNEPWNNFGSSTFGLSVSQALAVWPSLMALGNRLATPSISGPNDGNQWLADFMAGIASNGYRVDVINVHYYGQYPNQDINTFRNYLQSVHDLYGKPLIVTEWALYANWFLSGDINTPQVPPSVQAAWAVAGTQMMDTLDFVEKHFWYSAAAGAGGNLYLGSEALNIDGSMTLVGEAFYNIFHPGITPPPPPPPPTPINISVRGTKAGTPGSYFEVAFNALNAGVGSSGVGLANLSQSLTVGYPGDPNAVMYYSSGYAEWPGSGSTHTWASYGVGDVIGVFYKSLTIEFYKNGVLAGIASVEPSGTLYPLLSFAHPNDSATANFGATDMNFLPAGATSWDGTLTSGGRHAVSPETLPSLQQVAAVVGGAPSGFNPSDKSSSVVLSNSNLTIASNSGAGMVRGTKPGATNRFYEFTFSNLTGGGGGVGVANLTQSLAGYMGDPNGVGYFYSSYAEWPGSGFDDLFVGYVAGDVIGVHLKASTVDFYKNGTLVGTATALPSGVLYPAVLLSSTGVAGTANFGATSFAHLPSGALAWDPPTDGTIQVLGVLGQTTTVSTGGVVGITLNPADKFADIVLTGANLTATYTTSRPPGNVNVRGNTAGGPDNYFEVTFSTLVTGSNTAGVGVANLSQSPTTYPGDPNSAAWFASSYAEWPGSFGTWTTFAAGDVLGIFRRVTSVEFYKNGTLVGTATALPAGALYPIISPANNTDAATVNFGASAFSFAPSGALAWGTTGTGGPRSAQVAQTLPSIVQTVVVSGGTGTALTWDPAAMGSGITLSNGNLTANITGGSVTQLRTTVGYISGKHYAELALVSAANSVIGIEDSSFPLNSSPGSDSHGLGWYPNSWAGYNGNWVSLNTYNPGDTFGIAYDADLKRAWFAQNGTWFGDPVAGTGYIDMSSPGLTGAAYVMFGGVAGDSATINFGASGFAYTPPTGFSSP